MKIAAKFIAAGCICAAVLSLTACSSGTTQTATSSQSTAQSENASKYASYFGHTYTGEDLWGGEISITLGDVEDDMVNITYKDVIDAETTVYGENVGMLYEDGTIAYAPQDFENENSFHNTYICSLALKNDQIELSYDSGNIQYEESGETKYDVDELDADARTVILKKSNS